MAEREDVARLSDKMLSLLQTHAESLLALRDEACKLRVSITDETLQKDLDWLFKQAEEELIRVQAEHKRLGKTIRAPRAWLRSVT